MVRLFIFSRQLITPIRLISVISIKWEELTSMHKIAWSTNQLTLLWPTMLLFIIFNNCCRQFYFPIRLQQIVGFIWKKTIMIFYTAIFHNILLKLIIQNMIQDYIMIVM